MLVYLVPGKSTWTNKMLKDSYKENGYYLISRDKIRQSLTGGKSNVEYWKYYASSN